LAEYYWQYELGKSNDNLASLEKVSKADLSNKQKVVLNLIYKDIIKNAINVHRRDLKLNIYELNVITKSEQFSKVFSQRLVEKTNDFYNEIIHEKISENGLVLKNNLSLVNKKIVESINNKAILSDDNFYKALEVIKAPEAVEEINKSAYLTAYLKLFTKLELNKLGNNKYYSFIDIIDVADDPLKRVKLSKFAVAIWFSYLFCLILFLILSIKKAKELIDFRSN
jgi:hypothetical protein